MNLLLIGLFEKVVVADGILAPIADQAYATAAINTVTAWTGTLAFSGQIFCDFAGYSTCAIGVAMCLGFALPDNFRYPYAAIGFSDFWRRWHITLSTWLRDYLYIPLGGNRNSPSRTHVNLMLTMLIGGLWHGASWTFVVWGGLHGSYLIAERWTRKTPLARWQVWRTLPGQIFLICLTYALVCITWTFFRAESFPQAMNFVQSMLIPSFATSSVFSREDVYITGLVILALLGVHFYLRDKTLEDAAERTPNLLWALANAAMLIAIVLTPGEDRAFIYFQF